MSFLFIKLFFLCYLRFHCSFFASRTRSLFSRRAATQSIRLFSTCIMRGDRFWPFSRVGSAPRDNRAFKISREPAIWRAVYPYSDLPFTSAPVSFSNHKTSGKLFIRSVGCHHCVVVPSCTKFRAVCSAREGWVVRRA